MESKIITKNNKKIIMETKKLPKKNYLKIYLNSKNNEIVYECEWICFNFTKWAEIYNE